MLAGSEDEQEVEVAKAVFSYGAGRGDMSDAGDTFGMIKTSAGVWAKGHVVGYRLYQEASMSPFPFVVHSGDPKDVVHGTVAWWPDCPNGKPKTIENMSRLFGWYGHGHKDNIFHRTVVDVVPAEDSEVDTPSRAYLFYKVADDDALSTCRYFPLGDWLRRESWLNADAQKASAVFAYGTLRGDCTASGDRWGVIQETNAVWVHAIVRGFKLYVDMRNMAYPFAVRTGEHDDILRGTLVTWTDTASFIHGMKTIDRIDGYDRESSSALDRGHGEAKATSGGTYQRIVADAEIEAMAAGGTCKVVRAFVYYQDVSEDRLVHCRHLPGGDWLKERRIPEQFSLPTCSDPEHAWVPRGT